MARGIDRQAVFQGHVDRTHFEESARSGLTVAVAIGLVKFLERMHRQVKGDGTEQHDLGR
jgi:hypothetical protein